MLEVVPKEVCRSFKAPIGPLHDASNRKEIILGCIGGSPGIHTVGTTCKPCFTRAKIENSMHKSLDSVVYKVKHIFQPTCVVFNVTVMGELGRVLSSRCPARSPNASLETHDVAGEVDLHYIKLNRDFMSHGGEIMVLVRKVKDGLSGAREGGDPRRM